MFVKLGFKVHRFMSEWGQITRLLWLIIKRSTSGRHLFKRTVKQMLHLGIDSLPVTAITAICVGMAFTIQVVREFLKFGATEMVGGVVALAMWRELAPMMTGVVVAGRVGAAIAAELGSMNVTEQVEAMEAMSKDPVEYLILPRILAVTLMMPLLVGIADILSFAGGFLVALFSGQVNPYSFISSADRMLVPMDIIGGLAKAVLFGFTISILSSFNGLQARGGAAGVGKVTTRAVVISLIAVFVLNYFLSVVVNSS